MTYVVVGMVLFGREAAGFCLMSRAISTCFLALMGEFDIQELHEVGQASRALKTLFFFSFLTLMVLITLNMLICILVDVYEDVKQESQAGESLVAQFIEMAQRALRTW